MRFTISAEQEHYYSKHHFVEFEDLLNEDEVLDLEHHVKEVLCKRIDCIDKSVAHINPYESFMVGRDMWRDDPVIKKIVLRKRFAEITSLLTYKKKIRLAYDQLLYAPSSPKKLEPSENLPKLFYTETSLTEMSSFQGILGGLVLRLNPGIDSIEKPTLSIEEDSMTLCPIPDKPGNGIFFSPELPLSLEHLFELPNQTHLLIVFCEERTLYTKVDGDPHSVAPKKFGYSYGDRLGNETYPLLFK